ncbi:hypothetical protein L1887_18106 [Cichorium endivia]|nr:hypothetical protein L1887_18106 [Cichorium endivia]
MHQLKAFDLHRGMCIIEFFVSFFRLPNAWSFAQQMGTETSKRAWVATGYEALFHHRDSEGFEWGVLQPSAVLDAVGSVSVLAVGDAIFSLFRVDGGKIYSVEIGLDAV